MFVAILVAGGGGTRFGGRTPKQFLPLAGKPLLFHALARLAGHPRIGRVALVLPRAHLRRAPVLLRALPAGARRKVSAVAGGARRADSTLAGLGVCGAGDIAIVHDAARPLLSRRDLDALLDAAGRGPALLGRPVTSTLKRLVEGAVHATVDRDALFEAETPQAADAQLLRRAILDAHAAGFAGTDEASYLERLGLACAPVSARDPNLKVTTPADLKLAAALMRAR